MNSCLLLNKKFVKGQIYCQELLDKDINVYVRLFRIMGFTKSRKSVIIKYNIDHNQQIRDSTHPDEIYKKNWTQIKRIHIDVKGIEYIKMNVPADFQKHPRMASSIANVASANTLQDMIAGFDKKIVDAINDMGITGFIKVRYSGNLTTTRRPSFMAYIGEYFEIATCTICNVTNIDIWGDGYQLLDPEGYAREEMNDSLGFFDWHTDYVHCECLEHAKKVVFTDMEKERCMANSGDMNFESIDDDYKKYLKVQESGIKICRIPERNEPTPSFVCDDNKCCICLDDITQTSSCVTRCGHKLHMKCLMEYQTAKKTQTPPCPVCRQDIV